MKPMHDPTSENCSCTSCMYKSGSERPSIRRIIAEGSRIDKLYFGKYIPLRERKLLDKLVRTRAVYDDIRNQLLSESEASIKEKPNLKPRKRQAQNKDLKGKKSTAVIELVDMVDKGEVLGDKNLSECCSCCVCGSKTIHAHHEHEHIRKHRHGQGRGHGALDAMSRTSLMMRQRIREAKRGVVSHGRGFAQRISRNSMMIKHKIREAKRGGGGHGQGVSETMSRTSMMVKRKMRGGGGHGQGLAETMSRTSMMVKRKMGEAKRRVRSGAKSIMSEPCTCTSRFSEETKRRSKEMVQRFRPRVQLGEQTMFEGVLSKKYKYNKPKAPPQELQKEHRREKMLKKSYQKLKKSKAQLIQSLEEASRMVKESKTKIKKQVETEVKKSLEKIQDAKYKINENIKTAVRKSFQELEFPINKDSIVKFKEKIKTKRPIQDHECDHECVPGECIPEECFKIIKLRRIRKEKRGRVKEDRKGIENNTDLSSSISEIGVQAQRKAVAERTGTGKVRQRNVGAKSAVDKINQRGGKTGTDQGHKMETKKKEPLTEPRISIDIGTKKKNIEVKTKAVKGPKETRSIKSMTSIPPEPLNQIARVPSGPELEGRKKQKKLATNVVLKTKKRRPDKSDLEKSQPTPKTSSPVSFSIEIRKGEKVPKQIMRRQIYVKKREETHGTKMDHEVHQESQTKMRVKKKEAQSGGHALKRCFCTLKLKGKGYKSKPSKSISITIGTQSKTSNIKENVERQVQTKPIKSNEKPCITCKPGECDPSECAKKTINRHRQVGTRHESRSVSSLASRSVSSSSKSTTARAPQKVKRVEKRSIEHLTKHDGDNVGVEQGEQKQVVRISSSFSFNVEFYKNKPNEGGSFEPSHEGTSKEIVKRQNKGTHNRKHLRHRHSQISSVTGKSKYTLTKHSLRRCFCTLKLGPNKRRAKPVSRSTGSSTSQQTMQYTPDINNDLVSVNKGITTHKRKNHRLLPHECEPGVCVPGECDPYACLELINRRGVKYSNKYSNTNINRSGARQSNTDYRKTKSTSSFTSRSIPNKVKKIQSTMTTSEKKYEDRGKTMRKIKTTPSSPERQVVRIGSTFSFNIEFYKDKSSPTPATDMRSNLPRSPSVTSKQPRLKERGYQDKKVKKHQKSTSMHVKKKNRGSFIAPMKRCFCTLKLQTKDRLNKKPIDSATIGTETPVQNAVDYKNVMITKATKTKQERNYKLEQYECEPGICIPGECDPYECLERIQMRQLKESATTTEKAKMRSATSVTQRKRFRSKGALVRSKLKGQKVSAISQKVRMESESYQKEELKPSRQIVRIGSNFSFDIEFRKDKPQNSVIAREDTRNDLLNLKPTKKIKHRGANSRETLSSHQVTQASISQAHKAAGIRPLLKRCFCTLKLQGNQNKKFRTNIKPPKVLTVSRVTVTETEIKSHKNMFINVKPNKRKHSKALTEHFRDENWATALYDFKSSLGTISKSSFVFRYKEMQSYFRNNSLKSIRSNALSNVGLNISNKKAFDLKLHKKYAYSENCIIRRNNIQKLYLNKRKSFIKYKRKYLKSKKSSNFSDPQTNFPRISQLRHQKYYAMNIQMPERKKRYKLKPYECEPGVCVPDECDPYECQKLIMKRLMKKVSRTSGTNVRHKSMSSSTGQSTSSFKKLQSRQPREKVKKVPAGGMTFKTLPNRNHKQAVRVGSSFSFNIEFSKDRSEPSRVPYQTPKSHKPTKPLQKRVKEQGTKGHGMNYRDQDSQSVTASAHKGSGMKPMMQRCFCTLKLQKKGKNQRIQHERAVKQGFNRGTVTPPNTMNDIIASRTMMNAGQNTAAQKPYTLLPYECEPLVCVPGECDPYECLERIKKRNKKVKHFGTGAMRYNTSTGSMTGRNQYRTQGKQIQSKFKNKQTKSRPSTETRSSKIERYQERPSRQAVRVGSSFSFNVEFFKENSPSQPTTVQRLPQRVTRPSIESVRIPKQNSPRKKLRHQGMQDSKFVRHRDSQAGNIGTQGQSTMTTSFMKRCFCTAKLHKKQKNVPVGIAPLQNKGSQSENRKPFLERCFCVMKKLRGNKKLKQPEMYANAGTETAVIPPPTMDKKIVTRQYKIPRLDLEPYECEPGICVPGECNPYECEKLIKARNLKLQTRQAYTDKPRTRSASSNYSSQTSKARRTQSNFKSVTSKISTVKPKPTNTVQDIQPVRRLPSDRQVVRIGSTFSFNIEFYKDRTPNFEEVQAAAKAIRQKPTRELKTRPANTGKLNMKTRDSAVMGGSVTHSQQSQADKTKMQDRGSGLGPVLKRCFCTLKLQKQKKPALRLASQGTETMQEIPTLQNRGAGTKKHWKLKPYECEPGVCVPYECDPYECEKLIKNRLLKETGMMTTKYKPPRTKLLPYECEPGVCVPGQCDPYQCEKRIQLRNLKHRDSGTSPKQFGRKSVSSDIRSITGSKARKVQHMARHGRRRSKSVSSKPPRSRRSLGRSTRQSVRIGSGFSFDVEFYKDKSSIKSDSKMPRIRQHVKPTKSMSSSANQHFIKTKDGKMQYKRGVRDTDSQILAQKMRNTGVNPFLRRCFCTLKLQKSGDVASRTKIISRAARDTNVYLATLLPYECEPGVCVPGQCDPYECQKRIQRRLMRSQRSGTGRGSQDSSTSSTAGPKYKSVTSQGQKMFPSHKHQKGTHANIMRDYDTQKHVYSSSSSSSRQAVRLGSSFKFDVEFYKDRSPKFEGVRREGHHAAPRKRMHSITTKPKHKKLRSRSVTSSDIRLQHNQMQAGSRTESKSTGFGPRLKRCFCTLALHKKKSQPATRTKSTFRNDDLSDLYAFSKNVGVGTGKKYRHLKPYECEPGVCVPGSCDPMECYERIKRRMRDSSTATISPSKKYAASITSRDARKYRSANTQSRKARQRKERPTMTRFKERAPRYSQVSRGPGNSNRQAVRIGSDFSFSVEFYKDRPSVKIPKTVYKIPKVKESRQSLNKFNKISSTQKNYRNRRSYAGQSGNDQKCQTGCVQNASRGTTMGFLKRCFCTLNLYKNNKAAAKIQRPHIEKPRPKEKPPEIHKVAMVQTRDKYANKYKGYSLKPYECEPNVCIPGECDPYECEERIRRRNLRRQSRRVGTHRRSSQVSVGSMASKLVPRTTRRVQSGTKRTRNTSRPSQVPRLVEEPRFNHMFEEMRTGVKIGSNVSFNVEFYKDKSQASPTYEDHKRYDDYKAKDIKIKRRDPDRKSTFSESRPNAMHRGVGDKCGSRTCDSQASGAMMRNRGAGVNNVLKRCFCTLKLQKKGPPKVVTVNRLNIENINGMAYQPTEPFRKIGPIPTSPLKKSLQKKMKPLHKNGKEDVNQRFHLSENNRSFPNLKEKSKEMTTIYPYMPNRFNKNVSKTVLLRNRQFELNNMAHNRFLWNESFAKESKRKKSTNRSSAAIQGKCEPKRRKSLSKSGGIQSIKLFFRQIFPGIFSRGQQSSSIDYQDDEKTNVLSNITKNKKRNEISKLDTLKTSKSDRRPANTKNLATPKKSNSMKVTRAPEKKKVHRDDISQILSRKKYSHFQSGDTKHIMQSLLNRDRAQNNILSKCDNLGCNYCQYLNQTKYRSPYESTKIVQMSLVRNKSNGKPVKATNTTTNVSQKTKTRSRGVVTERPGDNHKLLSKCMCFVDKVKSIKSNNNSNDAIREHVKCVPSCRGIKNRVSIGDEAPHPIIKETKSLKGKGHTEETISKNTIRAVRASKVKNDQAGVKTKKHKKVEFDEASISKNERLKNKRKSQLAAGDAKANENLDQIKNKKQSPKTDIPKSQKDVKELTGKEKGNKDIKGKQKGDKYIKAKEQGGKDIKTKEKGGKDIKAKNTAYAPRGKSGKGKKFYGAKLTIIGKAETSVRKKIPKSKPPCVCGTSICEKETRKMKKIKATTGGGVFKKRPCVCGSQPCYEKSKTERRKQKEVTYMKKHLECDCIAEMERQSQLAQKKLEDEKKRQLELERVRLKFKAEDEKRKEKRKKEEKKMEKQVNKLKKASDGALAAESFLDVLKLGLRASYDMLRCTKRAVVHPRHTVLSIQDMARNPSKALQSIGDAISNSGLGSTIRRVRKRCAAMNRIQTCTQKLEGNPTTRFLLHMFSKDAKKRMEGKKRMKRRREPIDFECSLFMASIRRKPCLAVYYTCPWFYPHCLSMLNLWKQFTDVMLFLVAVAVWSPFIVLMEICRAAVCCFFCTG